MRGRGWFLAADALALSLRILNRMIMDSMVRASFLQSSHYTLDSWNLVRIDSKLCIPLNIFLRDWWSLTHSFIQCWQQSLCSSQLISKVGFLKQFLSSFLEPAETMAVSNRLYTEKPSLERPFPFIRLGWTSYFVISRASHSELVTCTVLKIWSEKYSMSLRQMVLTTEWFPSFSRQYISIPKALNFSFPKEHLPDYSLMSLMQLALLEIAVPAAFTLSSPRLLAITSSSSPRSWMQTTWLCSLRSQRMGCFSLLVRMMSGFKFWLTMDRSFCGVKYVMAECWPQMMVEVSAEKCEIARLSLEMQRPMMEARARGSIGYICWDARPHSFIVRSSICKVTSPIFNDGNAEFAPHNFIVFMNDQGSSNSDEDFGYLMKRVDIVNGSLNSEGEISEEGSMSEVRDRRKRNNYSKKLNEIMNNEEESEELGRTKNTKKNCISAKKSRQRKKKYIQVLEGKAATLKSEILERKQNIAKKRASILRLIRLHNPQISTYIEQELIESKKLLKELAMIQENEAVFRKEVKDEEHALANNDKTGKEPLPRAPVLKENQYLGYMVNSYLYKFGLNGNLRKDVLEHLKMKWYELAIDERIVGNGQEDSLKIILQRFRYCVEEMGCRNDEMEYLLRNLREKLPLKEVVELLVKGQAEGESGEGQRDQSEGLVKMDSSIKEQENE